MSAAAERVTAQMLLLDLENKSNSPTSLPSSARTGRMVAALFADGKTTKEIGALLELAEDKVRAVLSQPATQEALAGLVSTSGEDVVTNILKAARLDTVLRLIDLRDSSDSDAVRLSACKEILSRADGPVGKERTTFNELRLPEDPVERMKALKDEIKRLQETK